VSVPYSQESFVVATTAADGVARVVDWRAVSARPRDPGVLVDGGADETPEVYNRMPDVSPRATTRAW
jgi:hypothetical protein